MSIKLTQQEFEKRSTNVQSVAYDYTKAIYNGRMSDVEISCNLHGITFWQKAGEHMAGQTGCRGCHLVKNAKTRKEKQRKGLLDSQKKCNCCKEVLDKSEFVANPIGAEGLHSFCNDCRKDRSKAYRNREDIKIRLKENARNYTRNNRDKANIKSAKRRAARVQATVNFGDEDYEKLYISEIYHLAVLRENSTGFKWEVDHMAPLISEVVCGLHWSGNLQLLPAEENRSKSNDYWPDMW